MCAGQALEAAKQGIKRLDKAGIPWHRPPDYYAEMVKSDGHMLKVKEQLMHEQKQIEEAAQRCAPLPRRVLEGKHCPV